VIAPVDVDISNHINLLCIVRGGVKLIKSVQGRVETFLGANVAVPEVKRDVVRDRWRQRVQLSISKFNSNCKQATERGLASRSQVGRAQGKRYLNNEQQRSWCPQLPLVSRGC